VQDHLKTNEAELKGRAAFKRGDCEWWKFTWPLHKDFYDRDKLFCPYLATSNRFALDINNRYLGLTDTTVLFDNEQTEDLRYFLALLNSTLLTFRFRFIGKLKAGGVLEYFWNSVSQLPIRRIKLQSGPEKKAHDALVELADRACLLSEQMTEAQTGQDQEVFARQIRAVEESIDAIVYELYGITKEEQLLVENVFAGAGSYLPEAPDDPTTEA
jgi:TaqI-like C-terminal specificity domain